MQKTLLFPLILAAILLVAPALSGGQPPASTPPAAAEVKKPSAGPFHGKVVAVDTRARTIQIGKRTFLVTAESKITKNNKPARLEDAVVGEETGGYVKPNEAGKLVATTLRLGPKPVEKKP